MAEHLGCAETESRGQRVLHVARERLVEIAEALFDEGFWMCVDLCAVDYLNHPGRTDLAAGITGERFEVVVNLLAPERRERLRLRVQVPGDDALCPSLVKIWPAVDHPEREAFDLFGIVFEGHPGLDRILLPDDWQGHPLRKDHGVGGIPVQFKAGATTR